MTGLSGGTPSVEGVNLFEPVQPHHVLQAIEEYDEVGGEEFLSRYGFGSAGDYVLVHEGRSYDSKAILGVALKHATGTAATSEEFSGGKDGAAKVLEDLGFDVSEPEAEQDEVVPDDADGWREAADMDVEQVRTEWAEAAREELIETAGSYHTVLTHRELAAAVQERTGIRTKQMTHAWIGDVLARVARECASRGEPLLSALCVNADGSVGEAYGVAVKEITGKLPSDLDDHAAAQRLECHRFFEAGDLPSHGGSKALTEKLSAARTRSRRKHHAEKEANVCPTCQMALPATGVCDNCG